MRRHTLRRAGIVLVLVLCVVTAKLLLQAAAEYLRWHVQLPNTLYAMVQKSKIRNPGSNCDWYFAHLADQPFQPAFNESAFNKQRWIDSAVRHLRAYGACFLEGPSEAYKPIVESFERTFLPYFTGEFPTSQKWDGSVRKLSSSGENSFWGEAKRRMEGRGIVISIVDHKVHEAIRLIRVLSHLGNKFPIELVHKGDLLVVSQDLLFAAARETQQDVWIVDAGACIAPEYKRHFVRFTNKWIACLFNSFEEMLLMDTDAVPFVDTDEFFDLIGYRRSGAFFFRDRELPAAVYSHYASMIMSFFPTEHEQRVFGQNLGIEAVKKMNFYKHHAKHNLESGVVVMNRKTHLEGLLMSTLLQFRPRVSGPMYGDKELFWMGQALAGKPFEFNEKSGAAIGEYKMHNGLLSVCSTQVAHIETDNALLWMNGGAANCKKPFWDKEFKENRQLRQAFKSVDDLRLHYNAPVKIQGAIIPESGRGFKQDKLRGCIGYVWCAEADTTAGTGRVITFTEEKQAEIAKVVGVWS